MRHPNSKVIMIFNQKHNFEKLQSKMCKNALGISKHTPDVTAKAELGIFPLMSKILKQIFSYWYHLQNIAQDSLLFKALEINIVMDRHNITSFYSRIKYLLSVLDMKEYINVKHVKNVKEYSNQFKKRFYELYSNLKPEGRTEIYHSVKKNYQYEQYLDKLTDSKLRINITRIRTSSHILPIELLRRKGIKREDRICSLCSNNEIGSEIHILCNCTNIKTINFRNQFHQKLIEFNNSWSKFKLSDIISIFLLANEDKKCLFYFSIFIGKIFKLCKTSYKPK